MDSGELEPPDVDVAAGPGFVVQMVNLAERIWRTGGGAAPVLAQTVQLATLFQAGSDQLTDPRVEYDSPSGRWFASLSDIDSPAVLLAVSKTSDPTAGWNLFSFRAPGCADQPRLGMADSVVVIGADIFSNCENSFAQSFGPELWIVNKSQLVLGTANPSFTTFGPNSSYSTFAPVQSLSSTSTEYVVSVDNPSSGVVHLLTVDGIPPASVQVKEVSAIPITALRQPPSAVQPPSGTGRNQSVATNDDRVLDSVWENGKLWFSANTGCTPTGDSFNRACGRIAELSTVTHTLDWDFDISDAGADVFFPALRPDGVGNVVAVYGESSSTVSPQLRAIVRAPDGTFTAPVVVATAAGPHLSGSSPRYGDYFGAARDPVNPSTVWISGEIGSTVAGGTRGWNTVVASVLVSGGGAPPPVVPVAQHPPRLRAHAVSGRAGGVLHLTYTALDGGKNVRAVVTVRNPLNGLVYTATSAKATLTAGKVFFLPWRAHRAGRFTFCFRSVISTGERSALSCAIATVR